MYDAKKKTAATTPDKKTSYPVHMLVVRQCFTDVVVLTGLYIAITPDTSRDKLQRFVLLFFGLNLILRSLRLEYSDALNRGVTIALAGRLIR